jgi:hypothetical protein
MRVSDDPEWRRLKSTLSSRRDEIFQAQPSDFENLLEGGFDFLLP